MPTGPDHYRAAEQLLANAQTYLDDDSHTAGNREDYETEDAYLSAIALSLELEESNERTAMAYATLAQAHATLAQAAATALTEQHSNAARDYYQWVAAASIDAPHIGTDDEKWCPC